MKAASPYLPVEAIIREIKPETHDTTTYTLEFKNKDDANNYSFMPGQFNMISILGVGEAPISISSDPSVKGTFQHTIRHVGNVTNTMRSLLEGATVWVRGPYGNGWPMEVLQGKNVLIIAGGIGLAPLRPVIYTLIANPENFKKVELLYGSRTPQDALYTSELEQWATKIRVLRAVDSVPRGSSWPHHVGVVTTLFDKMESKPENTVALICGPEIMMKFAVRDLLLRRFNQAQIYVSLERRMSCGIGKCGNCQIGPKFVCQDGPVFAAAELATLAEKVLGGVLR